MENVGMPQLDPTWFPSQLFWLAVVFVALYLIVARALTPRIQDVLENRQKTLDKDLDLAAQWKAEAAEAKENYETRLAQARVEASQLLGEASLAVKKTVEDKNRELDAQLTAKIAQSEQQIEKAKAEVMGKLAPVASEITGMVLEILLQKKVETGLIDAAIKQSGAEVSQ